MMNKIMRPIEYRAWDTVYEEFNPTVAANLLLQLHEPSEYVDEEYGRRFFLQQYIGMNSYAMQKIFEGDILNIHVGEGKEQSRVSGVVKWCDDRLGFVLEYQYVGADIEIRPLTKKWVQDGSQVVGHIYDGRYKK